MEESSRKFKPKHLLEQLKQVFTVERVYGEPIETMGKTIIPVAQISASGGGGGGEGESPVDPEVKSTARDGKTTGMESGSGMGFGFGGGAKPVGFIVLEEDRTTWIPAVNPEKIALKSISVGMALVKMLVKIIDKRSRARGREKGR